MTASRRTTTRWGDSHHSFTPGGGFNVSPRGANDENRPHSVRPFRRCPMSANSVILAAVVAVCAPVPQEVDEKFQKDVASAREKAIKYLKAQQNPQGNWEGLVLTFV